MLKRSSFEKKPQILKTEKCNNTSWVTVIGTNLTRAVSESGIIMAEIMDQQCRLFQSLKYQTEYPYKYFREYKSMFRIDFYIVVGINQA